MPTANSHIIRYQILETEINKIQNDYEIEEVKFFLQIDLIDDKILLKGFYLLKDTDEEYIFKSNAIIETATSSEVFSASVLKGSIFIKSNLLNKIITRKLNAELIPRKTTSKPSPIDTSTFDIIYYQYKFEGFAKFILGNKLFPSPPATGAFS